MSEEINEENIAKGDEKVSSEETFE